MEARAARIRAAALSTRRNLRGATATLVALATVGAVCLTPVAAGGGGKVVELQRREADSFVWHTYRRARLKRSDPSLSRRLGSARVRRRARVHA
jgi:hypothetical protein